jgi:hypothetical protein
MNAPRETPSHSEIEQQLERLLASDALAAAPKLSLLLRRIVQDSLNGHAAPEYEYQLGRDLFERSFDWSPLTDNIVRQNVVNLRVSLDGYYRTSGTSDLVQIEIPRRQGLKARFSYNPHAPAAQRCAVIASRFYGALPCVNSSDARHFIRELRKVIKADPLYAPAYARFAEILLVSAMSGPPSQMTCGSCLAEAEAAMVKCLSFGGDFWLAQMVRGALACCRFQWGSAAIAFNNALTIASRETRCHFWYVAFLIATGRTDEAAECVKLRQSHCDPLLDPESFTIDAALLYAQGDFEGAHTLLSLMLIKRVNRLDSYARLLDGDAGAERVDLRNWVAEILMACILLSAEKNDLALVYADAALEHGAPAVYGGLACLALARKEAPRRSRELRRRIRAIEKRFIPHEPVNAALACMSLGEDAHAIGYLRKACDEGNPLMAWLHILPVFSSLRGSRGFRALLKRVTPH